MKKLAKILVLVLTVAALVGCLVFAVSADDTATAAETTSGFKVTYTYYVDGTAVTGEVTVNSNKLTDAWGTDASVFSDWIEDGVAIEDTTSTLISKAVLLVNSTRYMLCNHKNTCGSTTGRINSITLLGSGETYIQDRLVNGMGQTFTLNLNGNTLVVNERFEIGQSGKSNESTQLYIYGADSEGNRGTITTLGGKIDVQLFQARDKTSLFVNDTIISHVIPAADGKLNGNFAYNGGAKQVVFNNCSIETNRNITDSMSYSKGTKIIFNDTEFVSTNESVLFNLSGAVAYNYSVYLVGNTFLDYDAPNFFTINSGATGNIQLYVDEGVKVTDPALLDGAKYADFTYDESTVTLSTGRTLGAEFVDSGDATYPYVVKADETKSQNYTVTITNDKDYTEDFLIPSENIYDFLDNEEIQALGFVPDYNNQYAVQIFMKRGEYRISKITLNGDGYSFTDDKRSGDYVYKGNTYTNKPYKFVTMENTYAELDLGGNTLTAVNGWLVGRSSGTFADTRLVVKNGTFNCKSSQMFQTRPGSSLMFDGVTIVAAVSSSNIYQFVSDGGAANIIFRGCDVTLGGTMRIQLAGMAVNATNGLTSQNVIIDNTTFTTTGTKAGIVLQPNNVAETNWNIYVLGRSKINIGATDNPYLLSPDSINNTEAKHMVGGATIYVAPGVDFNGDVFPVAADKTATDTNTDTDYTNDYSYLTKYVKSVVVSYGEDDPTDIAVDVDVNDTFTPVYYANGNTTCGNTVIYDGFLSYVVFGDETVVYIPGDVYVVPSDEILNATDDGVTSSAYVLLDGETAIEDQLIIGVGKTYTLNLVTKKLENVAYAIVDSTGKVTYSVDAATATDALIALGADTYVVEFYTTFTIAKQLKLNDYVNVTIDLNGNLLDFNGQNLQVGKDSGDVYEANFILEDGILRGSGNLQIRPGKVIVFNDMTFDTGAWYINDGGSQSITFNNSVINRASSGSNLIGRQNSLVHVVDYNFNGCTFKGSALCLITVTGMYKTNTTYTVGEDGTVYHTVDWANPADPSYDDVTINIDGACDLTEAVITEEFINFGKRYHADTMLNKDDASTEFDESTTFKCFFWLVGDITLNIDMGAKFGEIKSLPCKDDKVNIRSNFNMEEMNVDYTFTLNFKNGTKTYTKAYVEDGYFKPLAVKSNLTLFTDFNLNFFIPVGAGITEVVDKNGVVLYDNATGETVTIDGVKYVKFAFTDIAANKAADTVTFTVTYTVYGELTDTVTGTFSIVKYAEKLLASDFSAGSKNLVKAAMAYVAAAYNYTVAGSAPAEVTDLVDEELVAKEIADITTNIGNANAAIASATYSLESELKLILNLKSGYTGNLTVNGKEYVVENGTLANGDTSIEITMRAYELYDKNVVITGALDGSAVTISGDYSLATYIYNISNKDVENKEALSTLLGALYTYCGYASDYNAEVAADGKLD